MEANGALATLPAGLDPIETWFEALKRLKDLGERLPEVEHVQARLDGLCNDMDVAERAIGDLNVNVAGLSRLADDFDQKVMGRWGDVEAVLSNFTDMLRHTEELSRRADDFDQKIGVLRAKVREIPSAEDQDGLRGDVEHMRDGISNLGALVVEVRESLEVQEAALDALASRLGRLEHAVETEGLGAVLRRLEAIDEALEGLKAGEGRPARGPHRKVAKLPEREEDLDGEAILTVRRWVDLEGELPEAVRREGNTLSMGRRLALAYRECGVEFDPRSVSGVRSNKSEGAYPVADLRAYAMWLTSMPMRKSFDGWLGYFQNHCLPAWTERALRLKGATA